MTRRRALLLWVIGWLLAGITAVCTLAPTAHADGVISPNEAGYIVRYGPLVCALIANDPTPAHVTDLWQAVASDGFTADDAGDILDESVARYCPARTSLLKRTVRDITYGSRLA